MSGLTAVFVLVSAMVAITAVEIDWWGWSEGQALEPRPTGTGISEASLLSSEAEATTSPPVPPPSPLTAAVSPATESAMGTPPVPSVPSSVLGRPGPVAQGPRFAVEFGPFLTGVEAEKTERRVNEAGYQTVRFRQQTGAALYSVLIEGLSGPREARAVVAVLRKQGFPDPVVLRGGDVHNVRVGDPLLLRAAVQLAETLRAKGHPIRVATQPGEAQTFVLRHGNFVSRDEAEARGGELQRLGLPNYVVRAK
jgi:hypothetical protein